MSITIKRNTGHLGVASKIKIKVNDRKVETVMHRKDVKVDVPEGKPRLRVSQIGASSNEIGVKDGDIVEITATSFYRISNRLYLPTSFILGMIVKRLL